MNYFAIERGEHFWDNVLVRDTDGNVMFVNYLNMTYDEMKSQSDLEDFVVAIMDAADSAVGDTNDDTVITLVGENGVFIWGILMGSNDDGTISYCLIDWTKDGKSYRYEP